MIISKIMNFLKSSICKSFLLSGCLLCSCTSILTSNVIDPAVANLQRQSDVELVCEGAASFLLMIDSLIESNPNSNGLLLTATKAYSGTIAALDSCGIEPKRAQTISDKAKYYGIRLLQEISAVDPIQKNLTEHHTSISSAGSLFWGAFGWLTWIQEQQGSPESMADLIVVEKIMARVLELDETIENGSVHIFFGALYGAKPAMFGGDFERSRSHFDRALEISNRSFLLVHTTFAETYCRMTFNRELHDKLLQEVIDFPIEQSPENTLSNQIAKRKAKKLLVDGFFD